jgi:dTDP-glucose pyrophosphorylase
MNSYRKHLASVDITVHEALKKLDTLSADAILFLVNRKDELIGSLTDGDLRRGFINGLGLDVHLSYFINKNPKFIQQGSDYLEQIIEFRQNDIVIIPVIDLEFKIINIINLRELKSYLPLDALLMAGGRGERLKPLTDSKPKPLLQVGTKPIIEHNIDRFNAYGIFNVWVSVCYLASQIQDYLGDGQEKSMQIKYIKEQHPLGTIGALSLVEDFIHDSILVMNSDLLTNLDFENFYLFFKAENADLAVACVPYEVNVPYAVVEVNENRLIGFKEKPTYNYYSNAGIYMMKRSILSEIPPNTFYNATDLMEKLLNQGKKVIVYPVTSYWLDIGKHEDYQKAQRDVGTIKL